MESLAAIRRHASSSPCCADRSRGPARRSRCPEANAAGGGPELQAENEKLWQLIQRLLRHRYGPRSEKLDLEQLQLVLEDAEQSAAEGDAAKDAAEPAERRRHKTAANRNRGALPAHLPRYEVVIDVESKQCPCCGGALHVIGEDRTEMLDLVPAQLRVKVVCRPRYGCRG